MKCEYPNCVHVATHGVTHTCGEMHFCAAHMNHFRDKSANGLVGRRNILTDVQYKLRELTDVQVPPIPA